MSDPLAMRIKAMRSGEAPSPDLFEADFDHERAAVLGSVIDLAFRAASVSYIDESVVTLPVIDVCGYGEDPAKVQRVIAAKSALKVAWGFNIRDALVGNSTDQALLDAAEVLCTPASGREPDVLGAYPYLRSRLQQGINTAVEEGVNFAWTVPGVRGIGVSPEDAPAAVRGSMDALRELAALDNVHLGAVLSALKGTKFVPAGDMEVAETLGRNLGYRLELWDKNERGEAELRDDPLDLVATDYTGRRFTVGSLAPNHAAAIGCPALKVRAFAAASRSVIDVFDQHELWPDTRARSDQEAAGVVREF